MVNSCVGLRNYKYFVCTIFWANVVCVYGEGMLRSCDTFSNDRIHKGILVTLSIGWSEISATLAANHGVFGALRAMREPTVRMKAQTSITHLIPRCQIKFLESIFDAPGGILSRALNAVVVCGIPLAFLSRSC